MGDADRGAASHQILKSRVYGVFALGVHFAGRLVQNQDGSVSQNGPSDRKTLTLTAGKSDALFANYRFIPLGLFENEIVGISMSGGSLDFRIRRDQGFAKSDRHCGTRNNS